MFDQWDMISFQTHPISKFYPQNSILTRVYKKQPGLVLQITCLVSEEVKLKKLNWIISSFHNLRQTFQLSIYVFSIIVLPRRHATKIYRTDNNEKNENIFCAKHCSDDRHKVQLEHLPPHHRT